MSTPITENANGKKPKVLRVVSRKMTTSHAATAEHPKSARRAIFPKDRDELIEAYDAEEERSKAGISAPETDEDLKHDARHFSR